MTKMEKDEYKPDGNFYFCYHCKKKYSFRNGTVFERHDNINTLVFSRITFYYFVEGKTPHWVSKELKKIFKKFLEGTVSEKTVKIIYKDIRTKISQMYDVIRSHGKFKNQVEIDESCFSHIPLKVNEKKKREPVWGVGLFERDSKNVRVIIVKNRTKETLNSIILENVELGSTIIIDGWPGYYDVGLIGFKHIVLDKTQIGMGKEKT